MPTYAVLGATGNIGQTVLQAVAKRDDIQIRAFIRSRAKLESQCPETTSQTHRFTAFKADISNTDVLADCLRNTDAAFLAVAASNNQPGCTIAQDQARSVVAALEKLREQDKDAKVPTLVVLSSSETDFDMLDVGPPMRNILFAANYYIYTDLIAAEKYLRQRQTWIPMVFFKPGGISRDVQRGHILSTKTSQTFVSFLDVAAAMVQIADEGDRWNGKSVSVLSNGKAKPEYANAPLLLKGLTVYFFPSLYSWLF